MAKMEKTKFRVPINHYVLLGVIRSECTSRSLSSLEASRDFCYQRNTDDLVKTEPRGYVLTEVVLLKINEGNYIVQRRTLSHYTRYTVDNV